MWGKKFSWRWVCFEAVFLLTAWVLVLLGDWPQRALVLTAFAATPALLLEVHLYYRDRSA